MEGYDLVSGVNGFYLIKHIWYFFLFKDITFSSSKIIWILPSSEELLRSRINQRWMTEALAWNSILPHTILLTEVTFIIAILNPKMRKASNTASNTHFSTHTLFDWLNFTWVPPNHVGPISIWWEKCVLEGVLIAFLILK